MIPFPMRVYLYTRDTDMRRSFNGLLGIIQSDFKMDILKGDTFLFQANDVIGLRPSGGMAMEWRFT